MLGCFNCSNGVLKCDGYCVFYVWSAVDLLTKIFHISRSQQRKDGLGERKTCDKMFGPIHKHDLVMPAIIKLGPKTNI